MITYILPTQDQITFPVQRTPSWLRNHYQYAIRVDCIYPPIPIRQFDYCAVRDNTYDGALECHCPIGYGPTPETAIADLLIEEEQ